ncbi:hypothetical protein ATCC90586_008947 [Pythium insidiosum]|nr:hypothetical protein ATCC90586_008947 [Pythium insidiosum]
MLRTALVALLLALLAVASADWVEFNREVVRSYRNESTATRFATDATDSVVSPEILQSYLDDVDVGRIPIQCDSTSDIGVHCSEATVLIAISRCLTPTSVAAIRDWVTTLRRTPGTSLTFAQPSGMTSADNARAERDVRLRFQFTLIPVTCDSANYNQSPQLATPSVRLRSWTSLGRVVGALPTLATASDFPIAVVSFVGSGLVNDLGYEELQRFARSYAFTTAINVQLCEASTLTPVCLNTHRLRNAVLLPATADALRSGLSLFRAIARVSCDVRLPGGRPVPYVSRGGQRSGCVCVCPAGMTRRVRKRGGITSYMTCEDSTPPPPVGCDDRCVWSRFGPLAIRDSGARCPLQPVMSLPAPFVTLRTELVEKDPTPTLRQVSLRVSRQSATVFAYNELLDVVTKAGDGTANRFGFSPNIDYVLTKTRPLELTEQQRKQLNELRVENNNPSNGATPPSLSSTVDLAEYRARGLAAFDSRALAVRSYGRYDVEMTVFSTNDSRIEATCRGCVSVVDMARPTATTPCPRSICERSAAVVDARGVAVCPTDGPTPALTTDTLRRADAAVTAFYQFQTQAQDPSAACLDAQPKRCDLEKLEMKEFFGSLTTELYVRGRDCFRPEGVRTAFLQRVLDRAPLFDSAERLRLEVPVTDKDGAQACSRCCALETAIRERWIDHRCDSAFDTERCDGLATERCELRQCLALRPASLVAVNAEIKPSVVSQSQLVLEKHVAEKDRSGFETVTQIHYAVPASCSIFSAPPKASGATDGDGCVVRANLTALLDTTATLLPEQWQQVATDEHRRRLVGWRYTVADTDPQWLPLDSARKHAFRMEETKITVEAWTPCGFVRRFFFRVMLHAAVPTGVPPKAVCPLWNSGWYQASASQLQVVRAICAHPQSSFAEITLDVSSAELQKSLRRVQCNVSLAGRPATSLVSAEARDSKPLALVQRFALQLRDAPETSALTAVEFTCLLTLRGSDAQPHVCTKQLLLQSCDPPRFDCEGDDSELCRFQNCVTRERQRQASRRRPAPFQLCGGYQVFATNESTVVQLLQPSKCCDTCGPSECRSILDVPQPLTADLRWCSAPPISDLRIDYYQPHYRARGSLLEDDASLAMLSRGTWSVVGLVALFAIVATVALGRVLQARQNDHADSTAMEPLLPNAI